MHGTRTLPVGLWSALALNTALATALTTMLAGCPHSRSAGGGGGGGGRGDKGDRGMGGAPALVVGTPVLLASVSEPEHLATDATHVYWVADNGERIERVAKTGGAVEIVTNRGADEGLTGLAVDGDWLYFTSTSGRVARQHKVPNGEVEELFTGEDLSEVGPFYVHGDTLYWVTTAPGNPSLHALRTGPVAGGAVTTLATLTETSELVVADDAVYGVGFASGEVWRLRAGAARDVLATNQYGPMAVALSEDGFVYWTNSGGKFLSDNPEDGTSATFAAEEGSVAGLPVNGGEVDLLIEKLDAPSLLQIDGEIIYYVQFGNVLRVPRTGGEATLVSQHEERVGGLRIDPSGLYWNSPTEIYVLRRKP